MKNLIFILALSIVFFACQKGDTTTTQPPPPPPPSASLPTVNTNTISAITSTTASSSGAITSDGGATVTARGICWATTNAPLSTGNFTSDGTGTGTFISNLTGLTPGTFYFYRAYATNSVGTAYGVQATFTTLPLFIGNVYVVGSLSNSTYDIATIWKNGVPTSLTNGTANAAAKSVFVSGTDVYVAGWEHIGSFNIARIWKNGLGTSLSALNTNGIANSVFVLGTDVYVAGYEIIGGYDVARVWKNGVGTSLPSGIQGFTFSIYVSGTDVYVTGYSGGVGSGGGLSVATLWKNGIPTYYTDGTYNAYAKSVYVSGTDVYVTGQGSGARMWKNGVPVNLTNGYDANSVLVSGTDVYVAGSYNSGISFAASVWKNGVVTVLPHINFGNAYSVFVSGADVYVAGDDSGGGYFGDARPGPEAMKDGEEPRPRADPGPSFAKVAQAVRRTIALEIQLTEEVKTRRAGLFTQRVHRRTKLDWDHESDMDEAIEDTLTGALGEDLADFEGPEACRLRKEARELLQDADEFRDYLSRPVGETIAKLCAVLGLDPDYCVRDGETWKVRRGPYLFEETRDAKRRQSAAPLADVQSTPPPRDDPRPGPVNGLAATGPPP